MLNATGDRTETRGGNSPKGGNLIEANKHRPGVIRARSLGSWPPRKFHDAIRVAWCYVTVTLNLVANQMYEA